MMVRCPGCNTNYSLDERQMKGEGGRLTCRECGSQWRFTVADPPPLSGASQAPARKKPATSRAKKTEVMEPEPSEVSCPRCGHRFSPGATAAPPAETGRPRRSRKKVLVVEDQQYFAELTRDALGRQFETVLAADLASAREALGSEMFDLVILDLSLEDEEDGTQLLASIGEQRIPVLIFTARDETDLYGEVWESLKAAGATDILIKGINVSEDLRKKALALVRSNPSS